MRTKNKKTKKVLLVIDMQNDFITGSLSSERATKIVPNVEKAISLATINESKIIFTRDTHDKNTYLATNEGKHLPVLHCVKDSVGWNIPTKLTSLVEEPVIVDKVTFGYNNWKNVISSDTDDGSDLNITLIGLCTDICVISNALILKATFPEAKISVIENCCAGVSTEGHDAAITTMRSCQINII